MYQTSKNSVKEYTDTVMEFGGLNRKARGNENEFSDMVNMSSREYPLLSPRKRRCTAYATENKITSLYNKEALLWTEIDGEYHRFFVNANEVTEFRSTDTESKRHIVGMGAYAVLFPDKKYINLLDPTDKGDLENEIKYTGLNQTNNWIRIRPCTLGGEDLSSATVANTAPSSPSSGDVWLDTSGDTSVYKKWDSATNQWVQLSTTYIRIEKAGIGSGFKKWDAVTLEGFLEPVIRDSSNAVVAAGERIKNQVETLNTDGVILYDVASDNSYIVIAGIVDDICWIASGEISVKRKTPDLDFVVECNNRLWGCKYGVVDGKVVNEIYACRQGDFKNWYAYLGISTDSYAVTVGSEGQFTGAAVYNRNPIFFKETCIHMIYGSTPSSYQMVTVNCEGVEKGQGESVCVADNVLFYKGPTGFHAFTGSLPQKISRPLGDINFKKIIGEGVGDKVYFACGEEDGEKTIYVYDTYLNLWHKEDERNVQCFSKDGHLLYMLVHEKGESRIESMTDEADITIEEDSEVFPKIEDAVQWMAESVDIGYGDVNMKHVKKITVRAKMSEGTSLSVYLSCDDEHFKKVGETIYGGGVHTNKISFSPQRCEFFRYRLVGTGEVKIISVAKTMIQGSDKP